MKQSGQDSLRTLKLLLTIPNKILSFEHLDNLTEFVLHELCHDECLNLEQAAYFVDNPDFNSFRGVAGVDRSDQKIALSCPIWENPDHFSSHMRNSQFNEKVRTINKKSIKNIHQNEHEFINQLGRELSIKDPSFYRWKMKHGNQGILLYQPSEQHTKELSELLIQAVYFLGFCPLFEKWT